MPNQDFTTYTKVGGTNVTITAPKIDFTLSRNEETYVYKDFGVNHFDGDFEHLLNAEMTSSGLASDSVVWAMANVLDDFRGLSVSNSDHLGVYFNNTGAGLRRLFLLEFDNSLGYSDSYVYTDNTKYYLKIKRDETIGSYGQLQCFIYSDLDRTILLDTLSLTLHTSKKDFRYLYPLNTFNFGLVAAMTGYMENLDIQEAVANGIPFFFGAGHY